MPKVTSDYLHARHEHILTAAATRFARDGFHRTSIQDVIDEAGLSPGAVYRYFRSKEEIIVAISVDAMGLIETTVRDALAELRPLPELVAGLPPAFTAQSASDDRMRLAVQAWGEALRNPTIAEAMQTGLAGVRGALRDRVRLGQANGEVDGAVDAGDVADVLLAVLQGFILQHSWSPNLAPEPYGRAAAAIVAGRLHVNERADV